MVPTTLRLDTKEIKKLCKTKVKGKTIMTTKEEIRPLVTSQQTASHQDASTTNEIYIPTEQTVSAPTEPQVIYDVGISRPLDKKDAKSVDIRTLRKASEEKPFTPNTYTFEPDIPGVKITAKDVSITKNVNDITTNTLGLEFIIEYPKRIFDFDEAKEETVLVDTITSESKCLIANSNITLTDTQFSIPSNDLIDEARAIKLALKEVFIPKPDEEIEAEVGAISDEAEWKTELIKLKTKYTKEYENLIDEKFNELMVGICKLALADKNHLKSLEESIEAANAHNIAKRKLGSSFLGMELPKGFIKDGQFLKKKSDKGDIHLGNITIITEVAHNDDEVDVVKVVTQTSKGLKEIWVQEADLKNRAGIMAISKKGASFNESHVKDIIDYFITQIEDDRKCSLPQIKHTYLTHRNGWKDGYHTFVIGNTSITQEKDGAGYRHYQFDDKQIALNLEPHGEREDWVEAINHVIGYELVQVKFCAAYGSPLIEYLGIEGFIFNDMYKSGKGKTLSDNVATSGICNPYGDRRRSLVVTGYATKVGLEQWFVAYNCLPYMIDEASLIEAMRQGKTDFVSTIIYMFVSGVDKLRGNVDGKNREQHTFRGILRMNGENDLSGESANTGEKARVINCHMGLPFDEESKRRIGEYNKIMTMFSPCGHFFPLYMKKVMEYGREFALKKFVELKEYFSAESKDGNGQRMAQDFAVMALAGFYINEVFKDIGVETFDYMSVVRKVADEHLAENTNEEQDITALRKFISWFGANHKLYNEPEDIEYSLNGEVHSREQIKEYYGFHKCGEIQTFKEQFVKVMKSLGYDETKTKTILSYWKERGIIIPNPSGASTGKIKVNGVSISTVRIRIDIANKILNPFEEEEDEEERKINEAHRIKREAQLKVEGYKRQYHRLFSGSVELSPSMEEIDAYITQNKNTFDKWKLEIQVREETGFRNGLQI